MPSHAHCAACGCANKKNKCKRKLVPAEDGKSFVRVRCCGLDGPGCGNASEECQSVRFHRLPKDSAKRARWLKAMKRANVPLTANTYICSVHFASGAGSTQERQAPKGDPSMFFRVSRPAKSRQTRNSRRLSLLPVESSGREDSSSIASVDCPTSTEIFPLDDLLVPLTQPPVAPFDEPEDELSALRREVARLKEENESLRTFQSQLESVRLSFDNLKKSPKDFTFYTGLEVAPFQDILKLLGDSPKRMSYVAREPEEEVGKGQQRRSRRLSVEDELLLTLVKLRHNFPGSDLACRFGISQSSVSRIFTTWMSCLYHSFKEVDIWPTQENVRRFMPSCFRDKYPSTRVVIDASEIFIEQPKNPDAQAATWSSYKNHNTLKFLLGVTPNGVPSFISDLYGGRISDKELVKRSRLCDMLERGDSTMADRGFLIEDLLPEGVTLNIPPFLDGREQFEAKELAQTRRIASVRIHVERAIERIKNFRILALLPAALCPIAHQIVFVCCFSTILMEPLLAPDTCV